MTTINLKVSESTRAYVEEQVARGTYASVSEYVEALIRADRTARAERELDDKLIEGLESGPPITVTPEYWREKREKLLRQQGEGNA